MNIFIISIPNESRKKNMRIQNGRSNLSNDNIISASWPGLKMGMDFRGLVWKRVWKIKFLGLKSGQDLENWVVHPHQEFPGVPPPRASSQPGNTDMTGNCPLDPDKTGWEGRGKDSTLQTTYRCYNHDLLINWQILSWRYNIYWRTNQSTATLMR